MHDRDVAEVLERMERAAAAIEHQASSVAELAAGLKVNGVLYSGTVALRADGSAIVEARVNFAAATVRPSAADVVIATQGQGATAPTVGPGVFAIPADVQRTVAIAGNVLVLYGTPGAVVSVTLWLRAQAPQAAETHPATVDCPAGPQRIAGAVATTILAAANPARRGLLIYNENPGATILNLALAPTASATVYTVQIVGGSFFELPAPRIYRGIVSGIWTAATGAALVTELV